ncbi:MAG TPA: DUF423 domain-containing protein [Parachlamydiaceae bacterium]|nr:DUF423 domain-containing protein [Parachlamydiaceae bacterium]
MLSSSQQWLLFCAALLGFLGVAGGAFGAHALKQRITPDNLAIFEVGIRYQMYHVLAIILTVWLIGATHGNWAVWAAYSFICGILIFSGSLYMLVFTGVRMWGAVTPIGGLLLLLGWIFLAISALSQKD